MKTNFIKTLFVTLFLLSVNIVNAHSFEVGGICYNITDATNKTVAVTHSYMTYNGSVVIPKSISYNAEVYSVTSIGDSAFYGCSWLESIEIPNSVTSIENYAFSGCTWLKSIEIPNSVTSIENYAFSGCTWLKSIEIPNSVTSIENYAFSGCSRLTSITIPNSVTHIGDYAFDGCSNLKAVINLSNLTFSKGSSDYGYVAYYANIVINDPKATFVGDFVFSTVDDKHTLVAYLGDATDVTLPGNYNGENYVIGNDAFRDCFGLASVVIGNSVTSIGDNAFDDCTGLTSITIPNSVTSIGDDAFYDCYGLKSVTIGNGVTSIGDYAFDGCSNLKAVINLSNLTFSKGSSDYGYVAYYANIVINDPKATFVGDFVFSTVDDKHTLVAYLGDATDVTLPGNYNGENYAIGDNVFKNNSSITSIEIPNSVTSIGDEAFGYCSGLTNIEIPNSVTSIGDDAFECCSGLRSIEIPNSITSIGNGAFWFCSGLRSIEIPNSVTSIGDNAFGYCSRLRSIEIPNSVTSIGNSAFSACSGLKSVTIGNGVTSIGDYAFSRCSSLTSVEFNAENCTSMGGFWQDAFSDCTALSTVTIGENVKNIPAYAFRNCDGLTSIEIPNSVTSIGDYAFSGCSSLTNVTIGKGVINMGGGVFVGCPSITTITLLGEIPPVIINTDDDYEYDFTPQQYETVVLYVPEGSLDVYKSAYVWKEFFNIKEFDNTGIENLEAGSFNGLSDVYYDLNGCIVNNPTKGIYIINGKKVLVK